ncbi:attachment of spindle microtubules to kinetochore involved in meiotic chromosome segregation [Pristimantis euphronides]
MMSCPGGSTAVHGITLRDSAETSCTKCGPGTYRSASTSELTCQPCPAGYSCPQGVENYKSFPCLVGYYCPSSATAPVPCPPGTYGNSTQGRELGDCQPCPAGTYNHLSGQVSCFLCGSSSYSKTGSKSCVCRGLNRSFQETDGSCICQAGFVFYDNREQQRSDSNSDSDCQPQVEERCSNAEVRLSSTRKCVSQEHYDCTPSCGLQGGELSAELGMCHCLQYVSAEELCDRFCLMKAPRISMSFGSNMQFQLQIEEFEKRRSSKLEVMNVLGPDHHMWSSEQVHLVLFSPSGVFGVILSSTQVIEAFLTGDSWSVPTPRKSRAGDRVLSSMDLASLPRIPNPILCLKEEDVVLFQLSISPNERMSSHYPLYQKDHLFNTNPHWDFGAFRRLDHLIRETHVNVSRFAHVFTDPGTYVFLDNGIKDRSLFVTVKDKNVYCDPAASHVQPSSPYQLIKQGIVTQHKLNLAPNWAAILGILLLLFIVMVTLLILTLVLRPSLYVPSPLKNWKPRWRSLGEPYIPPEYVLTQDSLQFYEAVGSHGSGEILDNGKKEISYGLDQRNAVRVLEGFNVRTLFDKLEDQNLHLTSQLGRHRNETLSFYKAFIHRIQVLKEMLQSLELGTNKCVEWRKIPLETDEESTRATMTSQQSQSSSLSMNQGYNTDQTQGVFMQEATALMKVVKLTLMKVTSELAAKKNMSSVEQHNRMKGHSEPRAPRPLEQDKTLANKNAYEGLMNGNIPMLSSAGLQLQPLLFMTSLYREENLKRLLTASPITKTLEEIKEALKKQSQDQEVKGSFVPVTIGNLVPMDMSRLSPRQLIVFRFGSVLLHLVCQSCSQYPLLLLIAQTIPRIQNSGQLKEDLHLGDFHYDTENKILFVPSTCLDHVGELAVIIMHSVAQISTGLHQTPINRDYLQCINGAVRAISLAFFHSWGTERTQTLRDMGEAQPDMKAAFRDLLMIHKLPDHNHKQRSCEFYNRFKKQRTIESLFVKNSGLLKENPKEERSEQTALQEETIDALNEEFLQLVKQAVKNKSECRELTIGTENINNQSVFNRLAEKRDLAVLFEIERRCASEKISAAESQLLYLNRPETTSSVFQTSSYNRSFDTFDK